MATAFKTTALVNGLIAVGHALKGFEMFAWDQKHYQMLPRTAAVPYRTGWFQGCTLFSILGLLNYRWGVTGMGHPADRLIAALASVTYLWSFYLYRTVGDPAQYATLAGGIAQIYSAFIV
ncbi:hypothetical protein TWF281_002560 [Arthrobotrys megalospora]